MTFCELILIKEPQTMSHNKLGQSYRKMSKHQKALGSSLRFLTGKMGMDHFDCVNSSLNLFYQTCEENLTYSYSCTPPAPPYEPYAFNRRNNSSKIKFVS